MFDCDPVRAVQPSTGAMHDAGPRQPASQLAWSNWSRWSNLFIELVETVLKRSMPNTNTHDRHAPMNSKNNPVQLDHLDQANKHAGFGGPTSCSVNRSSWTNSAAQVLHRLPRRRQSIMNLRRSSAIASHHQRGHAGRASLFGRRCALCVSAPGITALPCAASCTVSQWPRRSTALAKQHTAVAWCSGFCGARPLRPPAALLHKAAFCEVVASRCAGAPLGAVHRCRALAGSQNRPYAKWPSLGTVAQSSALPGRIRALRAATCTPLWLSWWLVISQALRALFWSVACGQSCCVCPRPPSGLAAARRWPRAVCPSAPQGGSLSPRAKLHKNPAASCFPYSLLL